MILFEDLKQNNVNMNNHYSDLYFPVNEKTTSILAKYPTYFQNATRFIDNITKTPYYDVPFAYEPYWAEKQSR